jgi:hypothetical protein
MGRHLAPLSENWVPEVYDVSCLHRTHYGFMQRLIGLLSTTRQRANGTMMKPTPQQRLMSTVSWLHQTSWLVANTQMKRSLKQSAVLSTGPSQWRMFRKAQHIVLVFTVPLGLLIGRLQLIMWRSQSDRSDPPGCIHRPNDGSLARNASLNQFIIHSTRYDMIWYDMIWYGPCYFSCGSVLIRCHIAGVVVFMQRWALKHMAIELCKTSVNIFPSEPRGRTITINK